MNSYNNLYRFNKLKSLSQNRSITPLDVLLVGGTGTGKSSTINALFGSNVAKVGEGVDPETQKIDAYQLHEYLRFHDSAGLGDGKSNDLVHSKNITSELLKRSPYYIDLVLVLLDGSSRDLGTAFHLLESVVLKSIESERVVVAINQADMAMKGRHWNHKYGLPEQNLIDFLEEQSKSVQHRIRESTGLHIKRPVFYSAKHRYNINTLIDHLINHFPVYKDRKSL